MSEPNYMFMLTTLGRDNRDSHSTIAALLEAEDYEAFCAHFVDGMIHQGRCQTGVERPVGDTTKVRIAHELLALLECLGKDTSKFDFRRFHSLIVND